MNWSSNPEYSRGRDIRNRRQQAPFSSLPDNHFRHHSIWHPNSLYSLNAMEHLRIRVELTAGPTVALCVTGTRCAWRRQARLPMHLNTDSDNNCTLPSPHRFAGPCTASRDRRGKRPHRCSIPLDAEGFGLVKRERIKSLPSESKQARVSAMSAHPERHRKDIVLPHIQKSLICAVEGFHFIWNWTKFAGCVEAQTAADPGVHRRCGTPVDGPVRGNWRSRPAARTESCSDRVEVRRMRPSRPVDRVKWISKDSGTEQATIS